MTLRPPGEVDEPLVLVVDDNELNRKLASDVLRAAGLRTIEAATGREALAFAAERVPDVILLDLSLPDMHGTDVARELRTNDKTAEIRIVALSASRWGGDIHSLEAGSFDGYLEKPIDVHAFPDQVRRFAGPAAT